jgi:hypothetical protein
MLHSWAGQGGDYVEEGHHVSNSHLEGKSSKARRKKGAASQDVAPFLRSASEWKGYVNVEQSEATKVHFRQWCDDADLVSEFTAEVLLRGYKLDIVQVDDDETVRATARAAFSGMPDAGYSVSAWASSFYEALMAVVYIVAVQSQFDISQHAKPETKVKRRTF